MQIAYVAVTILAAAATGSAAALNFAGAEYVKATADRLHVSRRYMLPFGTLLAAGAVGLLVGFAVPVLGQAAAIGLIAYFVCALAVHVHARDTDVAGAVFFLALAGGELVTGLAYHGRW